MAGGKCTAIKCDVPDTPSCNNAVEFWKSSPGIDVEGVRLQVCVGDITREATDAIATVTNSYLDLQSDGILNHAIAEGAGPIVAVECNLNQELDGPFETGDVIMTSAGKLPSKHIFHMVICTKSADKLFVQNCIETCLQLADSKGLLSIALPVIGTGLLCMAPQDSAHIIHCAFQNFAQTSPQSLRLIRVIVYQNSLDVSASCFQQWLEEEYLIVLGHEQYSNLSEETEALPSVSESGDMVSQLTREDENLLYKRKSVSFRLFARNKASMARAVEGLHNALEMARTIQKVEHEAVHQLSAVRRKRLLEYQVAYDVTINISDASNCVVVCGEAEDVSCTIGLIWIEITQTLEEFQSHLKHKVLANYVQWLYVIGTKEVACNKEVNALIEDASGRQFGGVQFLVGGREYYIDFFAMTIKCLDRSGPSASLRRKVLGRDDGKLAILLLPF